MSRIFYCWSCGSNRLDTLALRVEFCPKCRTFYRYETEKNTIEVSKVERISPEVADEEIRKDGADPSKGIIASNATLSMAAGEYSGILIMSYSPKLGLREKVGTFLLDEGDKALFKEVKKAGRRLVRKLGK